jgi:acid stress-induced BolA-like protein IbaG/YrbA
MNTNEVISRIEAGIPGSRAEISGDSYRAAIRVVAPAFEGLTRVQKQQLVYGCINELIQRGDLHAVTITALTPAEADSAR